MLLVATTLNIKVIEIKIKLLIKDYHDEIKPYLINLTNDYKTKREWIIHLTMAINFFLFKEL